MDKSSNGINGGKNGGRICWSVANTCCQGALQGGSREKQLECLRCNFFQHLMEKEGESLVLSKPGQRDSNAIIRDRMSILALLNQGYRSNILFGITAPQSNIRTTGTLAAIYPKHGLMAFNTPNATTQKPQKNTQLQIAGRLHGAEFHFNARLLGCNTVKKGQILKVQLPEFAYHPQLRQEYRVSLLGDQRPFQAHIDTTDNQLEGYLVDISANGLGFVITQKISLQPGKILENCTISLSDDQDLSVNIEVRHANYNAQRRASRLGGRFHNLSNEYKCLIRDYVNQVQREEARRLRQHTGLIV